MAKCILLLISMLYSSGLFAADAQKNKLDVTASLAFIENKGQVTDQYY